MRLTRILFLLTIIFTQLAFVAPLQEITIKTSSHCDHFEICETGKERLEKQLMLTSGIKHVNIDSKTMLISVKYNPKRITPEKIRKVISQAGYDADDVKADPKGVEQLDECCKK
ncbi:hypothetical protein BH11BAC7_BH11BAC7_04500 [soil metagenome]